MDPSSAPWRVLEPAEVGPEPTADARHRPVPWTAVAAGAAVVALGIAAFLLASHPAPAVAVDGASVFGSSPDPSAVGASASGSGNEIVVEVAGAVARPGVYRLPAGARVGDAIAAAGGYTARVDAAAVDAQLNLAGVLADADKVRVPARGDPTQSPAGGAAGGDGGASSGGPVDINTATAAQLDALPGIGPVTAAKVISARQQQPFTTVDDLVTRKVLSASTLAKIRSMVTVGR